MIYKQNKISLAISALLAMVLLMGFESCGRRHPRPNYHSGGRRTEAYQNERNDGRHSGGGGCSRRNDRRSGGLNSMQSVVYQPVYFAQNINVHQGVSLQETLYRMDPVAREEEEKYGVGGTKLIAEMSADVAGIYYSRNSNTEININVLSLNQLRLHIDQSQTSIYYKIINQEIVVNKSSVGLLDGSNLAEIVEDFVDILLSGRMVVHLTFTNITNKTMVCEIKQGQMLEAVNENVQNLVVAESCRFSIAANQQISVSVRVYCASQHRGSPSGSGVRFTPYFLNASSNVYETQNSVWNYIEYGY